MVLFGHFEKAKILSHPAHAGQHVPRAGVVEHVQERPGEFQVYTPRRSRLDIKQTFPDQSPHVVGMRLALEHFAPAQLNHMNS